MGDYQEKIDWLNVNGSNLVWVMWDFFSNCDPTSDESGACVESNASANCPVLNQSK